MRLTVLQRDQSWGAFIGDDDSSSSMRWVKLGA